MRPSGDTAVASVITSAGAADGAAAEVDQVPVVGESVGAGILAHRRHGDAVAQRDVAQWQRIEEGGHVGAPNGGPRRYLGGGALPPASLMARQSYDHAPALVAEGSALHMRQPPSWNVPSASRRSIIPARALEHLAETGALRQHDGLEAGTGHQGEGLDDQVGQVGGLQRLQDLLALELDHPGPRIGTDGVLGGADQVEQVVADVVQVLRGAQLVRVRRTRSGPWRAWRSRAGSGSAGSTGTRYMAMIETGMPSGAP